MKPSADVTVKQQIEQKRKDDCEKVAIIVLGILCIIILGGVGYLIYYFEYIIPAQMEESIYSHYQYVCDDHETLECVVNKTFRMPLNSQLSYDSKGKYIISYCIPICEAAYHEGNEHWMKACAEPFHLYYYRLFNRTLYEEMFDNPSSSSISEWRKEEEPRDEL